MSRQRREIRSSRIDSLMQESNVESVINYLSKEDINNVKQLIQLEKPLKNASITSIIPFLQLCFGDRDKKKNQ